MNHRTTLSAAALILLCLQGLQAAAPTAPKIPRLDPGTPVQGSARNSARRPTQYRIEVPEGALVLHVRLESESDDLALYLRGGEAFGNDLDDCDYTTADGYFRDLYVTPWSGVPLQPGSYYLAVASTQAHNGQNGRASNAFTLSADLTKMPEVQAASPGSTVRGETSTGSGFLRVYSIDVPRGTACLRLDLADIDEDVDLLVRRGRPAIVEEDADYAASGPVARESLLIEGEDRQPLEPGIYYVSVVNQMQDELPVAFTLHIGTQPGPPAALLAIPPFPESTNLLEHALFSTVELLGREGGGSGTILTRDGLILTNCHVLEPEDEAKGTWREMVVAVTRDPRQPAAEMFRARVVEADKDRDLALVRIVSGYYGQSLPDGYTFPLLHLGAPGRMHMGDPLWILGYAGIGGMGSRPTATLKRGIVSGFDSVPSGTFIKTDAQLLAGDSGGAALNERGELVGVPTESANQDPLDGSGELGFVRAVDFLPEAWRRRIEGVKAP